MARNKFPMLLILLWLVFLFFYNCSKICGQAWLCVSVVVFEWLWSCNSPPLSATALWSDPSASCCTCYSNPTEHINKDQPCTQRLLQAFIWNVHVLPCLTSIYRKMHIKPCHSTPIGCDSFLAWTMAPPQRGMGSDTAWDFSALCLSLSCSRLFKHWPKATVDKQSESVWVRNRLCVCSASPQLFIHANFLTFLSGSPLVFHKAEFQLFSKYWSVFTCMNKSALTACHCVKLQCTVLNWVKDN